MSNELIGLLGIVVMVILIAARFWIGASMAIVGFVGLLIMSGSRTAMGALVTSPFAELDNYVLTAVPMFTVMGMIIAETSIGPKLFDCANKFLGRSPGGVAAATVAAGGVMGAVVSSNNVACVIMSKMAYPELKRINCETSLASASVSVGGTFGMLFPPSLLFIAYGVFTETSIARLFMAGIVPGIALLLLYIGVVYIRCLKNSSLCPKGPKFTTKEKLKSLTGVLPIGILMILVLGSIYQGWATPTEAGAVGAFGAFVIALVSKDITIRKTVTILKESVLAVGFVVFMLVGIFIFIRFVTLSRLPFLVSNFIMGLDIGPSAILFLVALMYLTLGMVIPAIPLMVLTVPILAPSMQILGFDLIWFGVIAVMMMSLGSVTPPIGTDIFIVSGVTKVPVSTIFRGMWPFYIADAVLIILICIFPVIALWLPRLM